MVQPPPYKYLINFYLRTNSQTSLPEHMADSITQTILPLTILDKKFLKKNIFLNTKEARSA